MKIARSFIFSASLSISAECLAESRHGAQEMSALTSNSSPKGRGASDFKFIRKQGLQLASKMRYIAAQFDALLSNDLWLRNAQNANAMAKRLSECVKDIAPIAYPTQVNAVFATVPKQVVPALLQHSFFYEWTEADEDHVVVRWMCSWDTTEEDVDRFAAAVRGVLKR